MHRERLTLRETAAGDLIAREISLRADTINDAERTVQATIASQGVVSVFDFETYRVIDEVLVMSGAEIPEQVPLLDNHHRWSNWGVLGSCRSMSVDGDEMVGTLRFAANAGEETDRIWQLVRQGHLDSVSVGYRSLDYVDIAPGESKDVNGTTYTARQRTLRVTTRWALREVSVVPIGADGMAKVRSASGVVALPADIVCRLGVSSPQLGKTLDTLISRAVAEGTPRSEIVSRMEAEARRSAGHEVSRHLEAYARALSVDVATIDPGRSRNNTEEETPSQKRRQRFTEGEPVNEKLRKYLESIGLRASASVSDAWAFFDGLVGEQRSEAEGLREDGERSDNQRGQQPAEGQRSATDESGTGTSGSDQPNEDQIRSAAAAAERDRIRRITELAGSDTPDELRERAIAEGWDEGRAANAFLRALRDSGTTPPAAGTAVHSRSHEGDCNLASLQGAMMLRQGLSLDNEHWNTLQARAIGLPDWIRRDVNDPVRQRAMDQAHRYASMSLPDLCREAVRLDGGRPDYSDDTIRAAVSGGTLSNIFTTNVNAELLGAYMEASDTTRGWVAETDVPNFLAHERATMGKFGRMSRHTKGGEADHDGLDDAAESSKIARYSKQFVIDEIDIINDRFGALDQLSPRDMGNAAAQLRPDLVYALLLANASLDADSTALFDADHSNTNTLAFGAANLQAALSAIGKQRIQGRPLGVRARYLIGPLDLEWDFLVALRSARRAEDSGEGDFNPLRDRGLTPVNDDRLGANGVIDPATDTSYTGSTTMWFLAAAPGENGAKTIVVKYRRGTGRAPMITPWRKNGEGGQWCLGWAIKHDIGADADDYRALYRGNT